MLIRAFIKNIDNTFTYLIKAPLSSQDTWINKKLFEYKNFILYKIYDLGMFIGYSIKITANSILYADNFLLLKDSNYMEDMLFKEKVEVMFMDNNLLITYKPLSQYVLFIGEPSNNGTN